MSNKVCGRLKGLDAPSEPRHPRRARGAREARGCLPNSWNPSEKDMDRDESERNDRGEGWLRPQLVVLTLLAEHLLDRDLPAVFAGSFIETLARVGVTEHATRATLARMHTRGLLEKQRHGRRTYFQMTPRCAAILSDGRERIWLTGAVNRDTSTEWTLVSFSMLEAWQDKRHALRGRLSWAGFGPLQNGVWIAPGTVDVTRILDELELTDYARVFRAEHVHPSDPRQLVRVAFDLEGLAQRYTDFIETFTPLCDTEVPDSLALTLRLSTTWLRVLRDDPRVPLHLLPEPWPAVEAQSLFRRLHEQHRARAREMADQVLELAPE